MNKLGFLTCLACVCLFLFVATSSAQRSFTAINVPVTENFDTLATSGTDIPYSNNFTIQGWYATRTVYSGGTGSVNSGTNWSFGINSGSNERAWGSIASNGSGNLSYGLRIQNNTGVTITSIDVNFNGEQWRNGGVTATHFLTFDYSQAPSFDDLVTGTYIPVSALNFSNLVGTTTSGALNGNDPNNRIGRTASILVLIPPGEEIMLRWTDLNDAGNDHGLAIDDLSITPRAATPGSVQFSAASYSGLENGGDITVTVTRTGGSSGPISVDYGEQGVIGTRNGRERNVRPELKEAYKKWLFQDVSWMIEKPLEVPVKNKGEETVSFSGVPDELWASVGRRGPQKFTYGNVRFKITGSDNFVEEVCRDPECVDITEVPESFKNGIAPERFDEFFSVPQNSVGERTGRPLTQAVPTNYDHPVRFASTPPNPGGELRNQPARFASTPPNPGGELKQADNPFGGGTATGGASCTAGVDYITPSGTLNWADGDTANKTFNITICPDADFEPDESFDIELTNPTGGATLGTPSAATVTILNDDAQPKNFRSVMSGDWNALTTWEESLDGAFWIPATSIPSAADLDIFIRPGHEVFISGTVTIDETIVEAGGILSVPIGQTLAFNSAIAVTVNGALTNQGTIQTPFPSGFTVGPGGTYIHNTESTLITQLMTGVNLDQNSTFIYRADPTTQPSIAFAGRTYGNLVLESTDGDYIVSAGASLSKTTIHGNLTIGGGAGTVQFTQAMNTVIGGDVTIGPGSSWSVGSSTISIAGDWTNDGIFTPGTSQVIFNGDGPQDLATGGSGAGKVFNTITVNQTSGAVILEGDLGAREFGIINGSFNTSPSSHSVTIAENFIISGGVVNPNGSIITVGGTWVNSGLFEPETSTVRLTGTGPFLGVQGNTIFYNFEIVPAVAATYVFESGSSQQVANDLRLQGSVGNLLTLAVNGSGEWFLSHLNPGAAQIVEYVDVSNSNASGGQTIVAADSVDSGGNVNWSFGGQTLVVNTVGDGNDVDPGDGNCATAGGECTLRAAVEEANALAGEQTIEFQLAGLGVPDVITLTSGTEIAITDDIIINGPGADLLTIDGGTGPNNRIFFVNGVSLEISGLTLTDGESVEGGAIFATGPLTARRMMFTGNTAGNGGGGALKLQTATHLIEDSTFAANDAFGCGAIINFFGTNTTIQNSTFSGNTITGGVGGAICNQFGGNLTVSNSTFTGNTSPGNPGGGIFIDSGSLTIQSTIIAGNTAAAGPDIFFAGGTVTSGGFNLIGDTAGDSTNTGNAITYLATDIVDTPPLLGPLQNNGGPTLTHRPAATSPVIDAGDSFGAMFDQRGFARVFDFTSVTNVGDGADIGAFENLGPSRANIEVSGRVLTANGMPIRGATLTVHGGAFTEPRMFVSGSMGNFELVGLRAGETYFIHISAGRYTFAEPWITMTALDSITDMEIIGVSQF